MRKNTAIYPGSFDPVTNGHLNIIERVSRVFDLVVVAVARNPEKAGLFSVEERVDLLKESVAHIRNIEVDQFTGLLVHYAERRGARVIIRGLRAVSDFEYEFQMAHMNHKLQSAIETMFMVTGAEQFYISSHLVKEVARLGGCVKGLVPGPVEKALLAKFRQE